MNITIVRTFKLLEGSASDIFVSIYLYSIFFPKRGKASIC